MLVLVLVVVAQGRGDRQRGKRHQADNRRLH
jgi:hypothetical protein